MNSYKQVSHDNFQLINVYLALVSQLDLQHVACRYLDIQIFINTKLLYLVCYFGR